MVQRSPARGRRRAGREKCKGGQEDSIMELDDNLKRLMKELGRAINESLSESETISDAIANIRGAGYDVFLVLEATIGFNRRKDGEGDADSKDARSSARAILRSGELQLTPRDAEFLKLLRISPGDDRNR